MTVVQQSPPFIHTSHQSNRGTKERTDPAPLNKNTTPPVTLGPSASLPEETETEITSSSSKYRNRVKTSSIEIKRHLNEPRRRSSASLPRHIDTPASPILPSTSTSTKTRSTRSSTLSTTSQAGSSSSRPHLRSRASTNVRLLPPDSPTLSDTSSLPESATSKGRPRAMSSSPRTARQTHPYRKAIIIFSILVSLFLLGTVIVLSSVSYYLAFPDGAFLTEDEVPWTGEDLINALLDPASVNGTIERRQEWEELKTEDAIMGSETIPQIWDEIDASEVKAADVTISEDLEDDSGSINPSPEIGSEEAWGIDGMGSGSYWMKDQWDGKVHNTNDWSRLYNVTTRYVVFLFTVSKLTCQTWRKDSSNHSSDLEERSATRKMAQSMERVSRRNARLVSEPHSLTSHRN